MKFFIMILLSSTISIAAHANSLSPYSGEQTRTIKALSQQQISGYLNGKGLGYAKAAELNQYPGPSHVLELAQQLQLSDVQLVKTQSLFADMKAQAIMLGKQLVKKEQQLDQLFLTSTINSDKLKLVLTEIAALEAKIRFVHLNAHLAQKTVLTSQQVQHYEQLRGYNSASHSKHHHSH